MPDAPDVVRVARQGGTVISLCEAEVPVLAWWIDPRSITFTERETTRLSRVPAEGGKVERVTNSSEANVLFSDVLPDGSAALGKRSVSIGSDFGDIVPLP